MRDVLARTADATPAERRRALQLAYPFGERKYYPYKVWLDEIARQTGRLGMQQDGPCECTHGAPSHRVLKGNRARCYAADCGCPKYRPRQAAIDFQPAAGSFSAANFDRKRR